MRGFGWQVFGTLVLVFVVMLAVSLVLGIIFAALPTAATNFVSSIVSGTLVSPFLALVLTLGYFRLLAARGGRAWKVHRPTPRPELARGQLTRASLMLAACTEAMVGSTS